jgi:hypothetical protein
MSFLARPRRKSNRPFTDSANLSEAHAQEQAYRPSPTASIKSTSTFRRRLSSFSFLVPKRNSSKTSSVRTDASGGIGFNPRCRVADSYRSRSPSPTASLEEIRRPSGLGRRVSITAHSFEREIRWPKQSASTPQRKASISTPNLALYVPPIPEELVRWEVSEPEETVEDEPMHEPICMLTRIPPNLLDEVFAFVSPHGLASLARVCKSFLPPSRALLYDNVDLLAIADRERVHACIDVLASRRDLAKLVRRFSCGSIEENPTSISTSPLPMISFAIALSNMTNLISLKVPRYDPTSFHHTTFQLRSLTLLWETVTPEELRGMFTWLLGQPTLTSLSFPKLTIDERTSDMLSGAGNALSEHSSDEPQALDSGQSLLSFPFVSRLVPNLSRLYGPTSIVAALAPGRPLHFVTMHVHSTIYNGLRPSALMSVVAQATTPVAHLAITTTSHNSVDARSLERVLMAAGAELGAGLKTLEIESTLDDEVCKCCSTSAKFSLLTRTYLNTRHSSSYCMASSPVTACCTPSTYGALRDRISLLLPHRVPFQPPLSPLSLLPPLLPHRRAPQPRSLSARRNEPCSANGTSNAARCGALSSLQDTDGASRTASVGPSSLNLDLYYKPH